MPKDDSSNTEGFDRHVGKQGCDSKLMTMAEVANLLRRTDDAVRRLLRTDPRFRCQSELEREDRCGNAYCFLGLKSRIRFRHSSTLGESVTT